MTNKITWIDILFGWFTSLVNLCNKAKKMKTENPEKASRYVKFGIWAIITALICVGLSFPFAYLGIKLITIAVSTNLGIFTYLVLIGNIFIGLLGIFVLIIPAICALFSITLAIAQMSVNKKPLGWISLIISILCVIGALVLTILLFTNGLGNLK